MIYFIFMEHNEYVIHLFNKYLSRATQSGGYFERIVLNCQQHSVEKIENPDSGFLASDVAMHKSQKRVHLVMAMFAVPVSRGAVHLIADGKVEFFMTARQSRRACFTLQSRIDSLFLITS